LPGNFKSLVAGLTTFSFPFFLLRPEGGRSSPEHLVLVELNLVPPQQFQKLALEVLLLMVLFLTSDERETPALERQLPRGRLCTMARRKTTASPPATPRSGLRRHLSQSAGYRAFARGGRTYQPPAASRTMRHAGTRGRRELAGSASPPSATGKQRVPVLGRGVEYGQSIVWALVIKHDY
jgi:hypothetical protein